METLVVVVFYMAVILFDFRLIVKKKMKREIWIYAVTLAVTFAVLILYANGIQVPGPNAPIKKLVESLFHV